MKATLTTAAAVLLLLAAAPASAGPTDQLREYTEQVIKVLDDPALARQDRRAAVRKIAHEAFDVTETAKRVLARHWQARTPAEREEFTQPFADLLARTYIAPINEYGGGGGPGGREGSGGGRGTERAPRMTPARTGAP